MTTKWNTLAHAMRKAGGAGDIARLQKYVRTRYPNAELFPQLHMVFARWLDAKQRRVRDRVAYVVKWCERSKAMPQDDVFRQAGEMLREADLGPIGPKGAQYRADLESLIAGIGRKIQKL